jgi:uncharacterized membrane protein
MGHEMPSFIIGVIIIIIIMMVDAVDPNIRTLSANIVLDYISNVLNEINEM